MYGPKKKKTPASPTNRNRTSLVVCNNWGPPRAAAAAAAVCSMQYAAPTGRHPLTAGRGLISLSRQEHLLLLLLFFTPGTTAYHSCCQRQVDILWRKARAGDTCVEAEGKAKRARSRHTARQAHAASRETGRGPQVPARER